MRRMTDKQLRKLAETLPLRPDEDGDELLRDLLVLVYPTRRAQDS